MTSPCLVLAGYRLVDLGLACVSLPCMSKICLLLICLPWLAYTIFRPFFTIFWLPFPLWLAPLRVGLCLTMGFAFLLPTLFPTTISCHTTLSFLLRNCLPQSCWASLCLPFILLPMAQYGHWFFYYITGGPLCPICFLLGVPGPFAFLGLPRSFS